MQVHIVATSDFLAERLRSELGIDGTRCRVSLPGDAAEDLRAETLVYAVPPNDVNGTGFEHSDFARYLRAAGSRLTHIVLLSSAAIYDASHHHPGLVAERTRPRRVENSVAQAWLALEDAVRMAAAETSAVLTVLRPAAVPGVDGYDVVPDLLRRRFMTVPAGYDPTIQVLAVDDLAGAVRRAFERPHEGTYDGGIFHVAPTAGAALRKVLRAAQVRRLGLPFLGKSSGTGDYLRYPFTVSDTKIRRELTFAPKHSSLEAALGGSTSEPDSEQEDPFGMDKDYIERLGRTLFRFLHDFWWRTEWQGLEHVPAEGRAVLTGVHRGHQPWDGVMTLHLLKRELGRYPRFLIHPTLVKFPFLAPYMTKCGGIHACRENSEWVLEHDEILAIFPEGIRGAFRRYDKDIYKLGKFGRDDYVRFALRHRAPIVPYVTVGSAEIFPILGRFDWGWWKRVSEWPAFVVTPTMGTVPLPSKWHTCFLEPLHVEDQYGPEAADDRDVVRAISREVKGRMQAALDEMVRRRKSIFFGSIFDRPLPVLTETKEAV